MIQVGTNYGNSLATRLNARSSDIEAVAELARLGAAGGRSVAASADGVSAANDRLMVATSAMLGAEIAGLVAAGAIARRAGTLLQSADAGLSGIAGKLAEMKALAETATDPKAAPMSSLTRSRLDTEFAALRSELDRIAQETEFDGVKLLGGDGAGGAYQVSFRVGTGVGPGDNISVSIDAAGSADLAAGLDTDSLLTGGATQALANVKIAIDKLGEIQGTVAGLGEAVASASQAADASGAAMGTALRRRTEVVVTIDSARLLGQELAQQGGISLDDTDAEVLRRLLVKDTGDESGQTTAAPDRPAPTPAPSGGGTQKAEAE